MFDRVKPTEIAIAASIVLLLAVNSAVIKQDTSGSLGLSVRPAEALAHTLPHMRPGESQLAVAAPAQAETPPPPDVPPVQAETSPPALAETLPAGPCGDLARHPRIDFTGNPNFVGGNGPLHDLAAGAVDPRLCELLNHMLEHHPDAQVWIKMFKIGHYACANAGIVDDPMDPNSPGCRVSHHWHGRAADIYGVNGQAATAYNAHARRLVEWLLRNTSTTAHQVAHPFADMPARGNNFFSDAAHHNHIHIGLR